MSLLVGEDVGRHYDSREVFVHLSFRIEAGDRVGLVGPNGGGKTTLLRLLAGEDEPTFGAVRRRSGLRVSYLPQKPPAPGGATLGDALLDAFADLRRTEAEMQALAREMEDARTRDAADLLERYSALQAAFESRGGYGYEARAGAVLKGLGFRDDQAAMPLAHLSGGQRTRALLGRLLLEAPDLLLLDEPTNHLDLDAIEWVEGWLRDFPGSLLVVSHDRRFLESVTNRIWDLSGGRLETYRGGFADYLRQREERREAQRRVWEAQQEHVRRTEEFIRRNLAGQRSQEAKGRRTRLARFLETEAVERPAEAARASLRIDAAAASGERVLQARDVAVGYDPATPLLRVPELEVWRGRRVAIVGANGSGKTTLLRSLLGALPLLAGAVRPGANVRTGYLAQAHDRMDPDATVLDTLLAAKGDRTEGQVRTLLGRFLFRGDDVFKRIRELSGGQQSRVALARLALEGVNTLLLDEPTNHLDIPSQEELQEVLLEFEGTILFVSHDRSLVQALATDMWVVEGGTVHVLRGRWEDYLRWRTERAAATAAPAVREAATGREAHRDNRRRRNEQERRQARLAAAERSIGELEKRKLELGEAITRAGEVRDLEQLNRLGREYEELEAQLKRTWDEWTELTEAAGA